MIFTSFSDRRSKLFVYTNTIHNWASFLPHIQPVLFTTFTDGPVITAAKLNGWRVYPNPEVNRYGLPILKYMYMEAFNKIAASFYGFANGDILFDNGLLDTLHKLKTEDGLLHNPLLFGRRWNHFIKSPKKYVDNPLWFPSRVHELANEKYSKLFKNLAFDFFFVKPNYPFQLFKPLVISRSGFDTYFVSTSNQLKLDTIDGTRTVLNLHQTDRDGNMAHSNPNNTDNAIYNLRLIGRGFDYRLGKADNATYITIRNKNGSIDIQCQICDRLKYDII